MTLEDESGGRVIITLEGSVTREKVEKVLNMVEMLEAEIPPDMGTPDERMDTVSKKLYQVVQRRFSLGNFSSTDLLEAYEDEYNQPIRLSTISTYLGRFASRGMLAREKGSSGWNYRMNRIFNH